VTEPPKAVFLSYASQDSDAARHICEALRAGAHRRHQQPHCRRARGISRPASSPAAADTIPEKSIAVLPFLNMSSDKEQDYFSDGLSEELIDLLTQVPDLRVPARTSSPSNRTRPLFSAIAC